MNSVLQCVLLVPWVKSYFLAGMHLPCTADPEGRTCLACEVDTLYQELYSTAAMAHSPHSFLTCWWRQAAGLIGTEQQDAHEFFLSLMDALDSCRLDPGGQGGDRGKGLAKNVFGGLLRSDVSCLQCGYTSTAYDPFLDISLDLEPSHHHLQAQQQWALPARRGTAATPEATEVSGLPHTRPPAGRKGAMAQATPDSSALVVSRVAFPGGDSCLGGLGD